MRDADLTAQIRSFAKLPDGWHYGEGRGATSDAVETALAVHTLVFDLGAQEVEVFPGVDGGILISSYHESDTLEIRCNPSGRMVMWHEVNDAPVEKRENVSLEEIRKYVGDLAWLPVSLFDCYILNISAVQKGASQGRPSKHLLMTAAFLFSTPYAPPLIVEGSANTLPNTMAVPQATFQYSGESNHEFYRKDAPSHARFQQAVTPVIGISADCQIISVAV